ncbi:hypothetical protein [Rubellimicrobium roseum]|uniref:Uncharacterized protein n=1 Tax=Rubellimicrobium roseum TaxID=687525 RepID=A0A5C4NJC7_9RHOB|nr:hypothetical protein [Rubellimicrobium roseum]TNC74212.1 hypothetical protein FHG71_03200 [Rubellimicrobium roseum]
MIASPLRYSAFCALVLGGLAWVAAEGARLGLLPALLVLPLVAAPVWVALAYAAAVRKAQARAVLRDGPAPWWAFVMGGALARQVLAVPVALVAAGHVAVWLVTQGWSGWAWIALAALALYPVAALTARPLAALKPYARLRPVLLLAPPLTAVLLTAAWGLGAGLGGVGEGTLAQRVAAEPRYEGASALMAWAVDAAAVANGLRGWGLGRAEAQVGPLVALWTMGVTFGSFWLVAGVFSSFLLPRGETRRILRTSDADQALRVGPGRVATAAALAVILAGVIASALAEAEAWAAGRSRPVVLAELPGLGAPAEPGLRPAPGPGLDAPPANARPVLPSPSAARRIIEAERIGDLTCPEGTLAGIADLDQSLREAVAARRAEVERAARAGFDRMRARVPAFLDGYYSLTAEYVRTFRLVAGGAEAFLARQMTEALSAETAFADLRAAVLALEAPLPGLAAREQLLGDCGGLPSDLTEFQVAATAPAALLDPVPVTELMTFQARLAASGVGVAAGGVAGAIAGQLVAKLMAKEAFGLAAEAVAKLAVGKAAGGLGGAAAGAGAGALAGSVVPGIGTTLGALVGGVAGGLAIGVATDYALIEIEEAVSRDAFEAEIIRSIDEAEAAFLANFGPSN